LAGLGGSSRDAVVVALDPGPDDHLRADVAGELDRLACDPNRLGASRVVRRRQATLRETWIEVQAAGDAIDAVTVERLLDLLEIVAVDLLRVVELVVVHQVAEPLDRGAHPLRGRGAGELRLVAARVEARRHGTERPDAETRLHASSPRWLLAATIVWPPSSDEHGDHLVRPVRDDESVVLDGDVARLLLERVRIARTRRRLRQPHARDAAGPVRLVQPQHEHV